MSVGNVKSWRRISIPGRGRVGELLVVGGVLHRPVVRVAHVHRSDDRGRWLQPLVSQQAGWILSVRHRLYGEIWLKLAKVWSPLVHYGVEVVLGIVVISHKTWAHISVELKISTIVFRTFAAAEPFPHNSLQDILVRLGLMRLVVFCIFEQNFVHVRAGVLEQFVVGVEDDDGDLAVAEDGQLVGLLHQTKLALCERHLSIPLVCDPLYGNLFPAHPAPFLL